MKKITEESSFYIIEENVLMLDGVRLYTRSVVPKDLKKCPIVFIRTPYAKPLSEVCSSFDEYENDPFIKAGYAIVSQHCRGTGESEGVCVPYENERNDGLCTLDYIRTLDFYNGEIYLKGGSYLSSVHLLYLSERQSDIKGAILEIQTDRMYFRNYKNGCNYNFCNFEWWMSMKKREYPSIDFSGAYRRPFADIARRVVGKDIPEFTDMLINDEYNDYWKNDPRTNVVDCLDFPVLFVEGWYDFYIDGMFSMWERLPSLTKQKSAFIVGPFAHDVKVNPKFDYPNLKNGNLPTDYAVEWFNSIRRNISYKYAAEGRVNYYSIGADHWYKDGKTYEYVVPLAAPGSECTYLEYKYDPEIKVNLFKNKGLYKTGDTRGLPGVNTLYLHELVKSGSYYGKIKLRLSVSSDCEDTAFYLCLYLVEDGESYPLCEAITSLSHFYPDYKPGEPAELDFEFNHIAFTVKKGAGIRIDISSTGGSYVPHSNIRGHFAYVTSTRTANNKIRLDRSYLTLPLSE